LLARRRRNFAVKMKSASEMFVCAHVDLMFVGRRCAIREEGTAAGGSY
jgi:hypothetical protein